MNRQGFLDFHDDDRIGSVCWCGGCSDDPCEIRDHGGKAYTYGAGVAFGLMGMAFAIQTRPCVHPLRGLRQGRDRSRGPVPVREVQDMNKLDWIRARIENGLRDRGFATTVEVVSRGEGRFFASAPMPIPRTVWEDVLRENLEAGAWPLTVLVEPKPTDS